MEIKKYWDPKLFFISVMVSLMVGTMASIIFSVPPMRKLRAIPILGALVGAIPLYTTMLLSKIIAKGIYK